MRITRNTPVDCLDCDAFAINTVMAAAAPVLARATPRAFESPLDTVVLPAGRSLLLDWSHVSAGHGIEMLQGMARVSCPCPDEEGMTLAFLQPGDQLRSDRLSCPMVCLEALTPVVIRRGLGPDDDRSQDPVQDWTLQLLRIRHLRSAEERLHALLALLVMRLGRRSGSWCDLPFRLSHERIGELIGTTRVTCTRMLSRIRKAQLLEVPAGAGGLRLAPELIESAPLAGI